MSASSRDSCRTRLRASAGSTRGSPSTMTTVAILEDQRLFREALVSFLEASGFTVTCATADPMELLASVRARAPALALVDLFLSGINDPELAEGFEIIRELRRWVPDVKPVVLSGSYDPASVEGSYEAGAVA